MTEIIVLGTQTEKRFPVAPQSHARLRIKLPKVFSADDVSRLREAFAKEELDVAKLGQTILETTGKAYAFLLVLAPAIETAMPEHEWQGFGSAEALAIGDDAYVEADDNSPHLEQIIVALETALKVNGMSKLGELLGTVNDVTSIMGGPGGPPASGRPS
jgi:hypothetical protein